MSRFNPLHSFLEMTKYTTWNAIGHVHDKKMIMYTKYTAYRPVRVWSEQSILLDLYTILSDANRRFWLLK